MTQQSDPANGQWAIRKVAQQPRGPVTEKTVKDLSRDRSLRGVARVAKKYAG